MDFPNADLTEEEELDQLEKDIAAGCCVGDYSETGEIDELEQMLWDREGHPCDSTRTELLERLLQARRITFIEEQHPDLSGQRRRVYSLRTGR